MSKWCVHVYDTVGSTNDIAHNLPPWNAVRADCQTSGRGRHGRSWISHYGGLWLSLVLPVSRERDVWATLPLAMGWAIVKVIKDLGVHEVRLRWPNDILVRNMKLAGLLVEQFCEDVAVVGIGINVLNRPEQINQEFPCKVIHLSDIVKQVPGLYELTGLILKTTEDVHRQMEKNGFTAILDEINAARGWGCPRRAELELDEGIRREFFIGVNKHGELITKNDSGHVSYYPPCRVKLFREI
mgnify:FL=1